MATYYTDEIIETIKSEYPYSDNDELAKKLGISESALRTKASRLGLKKNQEYMDNIYKKMQKYRKIKQNDGYKNYEMTNIEKNIIIGSLIGDGTLSLYGRSKNACYRENTGTSQIDYRKWKAEKLKNLGFKINKYGAIYSPSHPIYTEFYKLFYRNGKKILTENNLKLLNHPIGLACLFMDDGSLIIDSFRKRNKISLFPRIYFYTQSFSFDENLLLKQHLENTFNIHFNLKNWKDGKKSILEISKRDELISFIEIVKPYVEKTECMEYKINIESKMKEIKKRYVKKFPNKEVILSSIYIEDNSYSSEDESKIIEMYKQGYPYTKIANTLSRTYYGLYDKVRRMKNEGKI